MPTTRKPPDEVTAFLTFVLDNPSLMPRAGSLFVTGEMWHNRRKTLVVSYSRCLWCDRIYGIAPWPIHVTSVGNPNKDYPFRWLDLCARCFLDVENVTKVRYMDTGRVPTIHAPTFLKTLETS